MRKKTVKTIRRFLIFEEFYGIFEKSFEQKQYGFQAYREKSVGVRLLCRNREPVWELQEENRALMKSCRRSPLLKTV